jgi:acetyl esterase/lipase
MPTSPWPAHHANQGRGRPAAQPGEPATRVTDYIAGHDAALGLISPIFADLSGLPPLIIQAGTHEVLLDDAVRLAGRAASADVEVTLDITPGVRSSGGSGFTRRYRVSFRASSTVDWSIRAVTS